MTVSETNNIIEVFYFGTEVCEYVQLMQSKSLFSFPLSELALRFSLCRTSSSSNRLEVVVVQYYIVKLANEQTTKGEFDPPLFSQSVPFTQERSICICGHNHLAQSSNSAFDTINQPAAHEWFCIFGKQYLLLLHTSTTTHSYFPIKFKHPQLRLSRFKERRLDS